METSRARSWVLCALVALAAACGTYHAPADAAETPDGPLPDAAVDAPLPPIDPCVLDESRIDGCRL